MIFFDLDGPLLDVSEKYYQVYLNILFENGFECISKTKYWENKRNKVKENITLSESNAFDFYEKYKKIRFERIETLEYLKYDLLQKNVKDVLEQVKKKRELHLVTLRHDRNNLLVELETMGLKNYFQSILSSGEDIEPKWMIKYKLIKENFSDSFSKEDFFIGDTETDIQAGKNLGMTTITVLSGIRSKEHLKKQNPDYIINGVWELGSIIQ